jgi:transposase-like protein
MAQLQVTLNEQVLHQLFADDPKGSGMKTLMETILNQLLQAQAKEQLQAAPYERKANRTDYRNGTYPRQLTTRVGRLQLHVPRLRNGHFSTQLFQRYQRSERALILALMEMVVDGVSTRRVSQITETLCGTAFSASTVSDLCGQLDPLVQAWNNRSLKAHAYPFLFVDAVYTKVRENGRIRSKGVMMAYGINDAGYRNILGLKVGDSESEAAWRDYFRWLKARGLHGVDILTSDDHGGLVAAVTQTFQNVSWQRCQAHFLRNVRERLGKNQKRPIGERVREILHAPNTQVAKELLDAFSADYEQQLPTITQLVENAYPDVTAVLPLPETYRRRVRTTNGLERLNEEFRRRERVIRIFPNVDSVVRLMGALLMELDEQWSSGRRYLNMDAYWTWRAKERAKAKKGAPASAAPAIS